MNYYLVYTTAIITKKFHKITKDKYVFFSLLILSTGYKCII